YHFYVYISNRNAMGNHRQNQHCLYLSANCTFSHSIPISVLPQSPPNLGRKSRCLEVVATDRGGSSSSQRCRATGGAENH
ncbi:hypothetical protein, partial [Moorena sp. SIO2C4]|uniref:hypothetical protein n=1 Tax=Moorena sp. SIO2C4 TaxID=2607824 RepID=UPI00257C52EF